MRATMNKISNKILSMNVNYEKLLKISLVLICVGAFMSFLFIPQFIKFIVKQFAILKPGRYVRKVHEDLPFTYKLYLWNVTNPNEITAGIEKPKMQEIGPYVFSQRKLTVDTTDNKTDDTYSFNLINIYNFSPRLSLPLTGDETVTLLNPVLLSGLVKAKIETPQLLNVAIEGMDQIFQNPSSIFVTMKAMEFIDNGFAINCNQTKFAGKAVCREMRESHLITIIDNDKTRLRYRWFDRLNNSVQARYTLLRGVKNIHDAGRVNAINEKSTLNVYKEDERCNVINGTDKIFFAPFQRKEATIWVYAHDACKSYPLVYQYMTTTRGTKTAWKSLYMSDPLLSPTCDCNQFTGCTMKGTSDLHSCTNIFATGSLPHFYSADESIRATLDGMDPKEHLHKAGIYMDLLTGIPVLAVETFQVNFLVKRISEYPILSSVADGSYIPMLWYYESFTPKKIDFALIILCRLSMKLGVITGYILMCIGTVGCIAALILRSRQDVIPLETTVPKPMPINTI